MNKRILVISVLAFSCIPLWGQQANPPDANAQNAALEQRIRDLEDRVISLEGKIRTASPAATSPGSTSGAKPGSRCRADCSAHNSATDAFTQRNTVWSRQSELRSGAGVWGLFRCREGAQS